MDSIEGELLAAWRRHNELLLFLLDKIPAGGAAAVPAESRGRGPNSSPTSSGYERRGSDIMRPANVPTCPPKR